MTTGDPGLDALIVVGSMLLILGPLVLIAWPLEETERGRRLTAWLLRRLGAVE